MQIPALSNLPGRRVVQARFRGNFVRGRGIVELARELAGLAGLLGWLGVLFCLAATVATGKI